MGKKEDAAFQDWVESLKGRVSEQAFKAITEDEGAKEVFRGHLREDEFHRRLTELDLAKKQLAAEQEALRQEQGSLELNKEKWQSWYVEASGDFEKLSSENEELKKRLETQPQVSGAPQGGNAVDQASEKKLEALAHELEMSKSRLEAVNKTLPRLLGDFGDVLAKATKEGWKVQPKELLNTALTRGIDMDTAFYELTSQERAQREEAALQQIEKDAYERGKREAQSSAPPDSFRGAVPGTIDHLRKTSTATGPERVANAVKAYMEMQQGA
jgi:hypothetical protein